MSIIHQEIITAECGGRVVKAADINDSILETARAWADAKGWKGGEPSKHHHLVVTGGRAALVNSSNEIVGEEARVMCIASDRSGYVWWEAGPFRAYYDDAEAS